jgi:hypothetical protein
MMWHLHGQDKSRLVSQLHRKHALNSWLLAQLHHPSAVSAATPAVWYQHKQGEGKAGKADTTQALQDPLT